MLALKSFNWFYCVRNELSNLLANQTLSIKQQSFYNTCIFPRRFPHILSRSIDADQLITNTNVAIESKTRYQYLLDNTYNIICYFHLRRENYFRLKNKNWIEYQMASYKDYKEETGEKRNRRKSRNKHHSGRFRRGGVWHEHKCKWCGFYYVHFHPMKFYGHSQFKYQCPNKDCESYHNGTNDTRAYSAGHSTKQKR